MKIEQQWLDETDCFLSLTLESKNLNTHSRMTDLDDEHKDEIRSILTMTLQNVTRYIPPLKNQSK